MRWKTWAIGLGISMFVLAVIGLVVHSDKRLVIADVLGGVAAIAIVLAASAGRATAVATPIVATVVFFAMALLAVTSHHAPIFTALTLAFAFAFAFVSWTAMSSRRRPHAAA